MNSISTKQQSAISNLLFAVVLILAVILQLRFLILNLQINKAFVGIKYIGQTGSYSRINSEFLLLNANEYSSTASKCTSRGLGQLYILEDNTQEAKRWLLQSIDICPVNPITNYFLGKIFWKNNDKQRAIEFWQQAKVENYFLTVGKEAATTEYYDEAISALRTALEINPSLVSARLELGKALIENGQANKAIIELQKTINLASKQQEKDIFLWLGHAYEAAGLLEEALIAYQKAYDRSSQNDEHIADFLGRTFYKLGKYDNAEIFLLESKNFGPSNPYINYLLANIYLLQNDLVQAEEYAIQAINTAPQIAVYHEILGDIYHAQNKTELSFGEYQTAFCLAKSDTLIQNRIKSKLTKPIESINCVE